MHNSLVSRATAEISVVPGLKCTNEGVSRRAIMPCEVSRLSVRIADCNRRQDGEDWKEQIPPQHQAMGVCFSGTSARADLLCEKKMGFSLPKMVG